MEIATATAPTAATAEIVRRMDLMLLPFFAEDITRSRYRHGALGPED
jgi:hypothetical protein